MTFEWLTKELKQIDYNSKQDEMLNKYMTDKDQDYYTVVLNNDGTCLAYPEGKSITIEDKDLLNNLKKHRRGITDMTVNGVPATIYYGPVNQKDVDWAVAVVVLHP